MKNKDKHYLKALLLASMSSIGITASNAAGTSSIIAKKEREGSDTSTEMVSEALTSGILESHPSFGEVFGHTSHSSHSSHGSHTSSSHGSHSSHTSSSHTSHTSHTSSSHTSHTSSSHTSHTSSSGYGNGGYGGTQYGGTGGATHSGSSTELKGLLIGSGVALAGVGVYALVRHIIKTHKKHVASRKADINRYRAFASRDLSSGIYGNDVDRMTDLLIENDVLESWDRTVSRKWSHIKYNRKVKRSVKQMQARMGQQRTGKASKAFQMNLQQWKNSRAKLISATSIDSMDIAKEHDALLAVAILLVEKGYMKNYDADDIMSKHEKSKIIKAYKTFLRRNQLQESTLVDEHRLRLLNSLPNKQK